MPDNEPKHHPAVLTDAQWKGIVSISEAGSLGEDERLNLDSIIFDFRNRNKQQEQEKRDGRSPSDIRRELLALNRLASKLVTRISALRANRHALPAISAAMYADTSEGARRRQK